MKFVIAILAFLVIWTSVALAQGQPKVQHPALALYAKGQFAEAVRALEIATKTKEFKSDAEIWNFLGLSYLATQQLKNSRKAFEKSVSLDPASAVYRSNLAYAYIVNGQIGKARESADHAITLDPRIPGAYEVRGTANFRQRKFDLAERDADHFIRLDPANPQAYLLKSDILMAGLGDRMMSQKTFKEGIEYLKRATEVLKTGVDACKAGKDCAEIARRREAINAFYDHFSRDRTPPAILGDVPTPEPDVTPLKITNQPRASYTDDARAANVQGSIRVAILLGINGKVEHILFLSRLGHGLDQQVLKAVGQMEFEPKKKGGTPIPVVVIREYTFSIY